MNLSKKDKKQQKIYKLFINDYYDLKKWRYFMITLYTDTDTDISLSLANELG